MTPACVSFPAIAGAPHPGAAAFTWPGPGPACQLHRLLAGHSRAACGPHAVGRGVVVGAGHYRVRRIRARRIRPRLPVLHLWFSGAHAFDGEILHTSVSLILLDPIVADDFYMPRGEHLQDSCSICAQVTKVKLEQKQREGIAEARCGRRSTVSSRYASSKTCWQHTHAKPSNGSHTHLCISIHAQHSHL